jgi:SAM-dependent methyltransferase
MSSQPEYPLGYSDQESRRLASQAALLEELTADVFRRAGLGAGMSVLDLGCGVGDVSLLAARMVGPNGSVLGIERAASSVQVSRQRAASLGAGNVSFAEADLATFEPQQTFAAIVGRLILLYLPDPAAVLRRLSRALRPGGIVAFQEYDMSQTSQVPAGELFVRVSGWLMAAFEAGGVERDMGTRLYTTFLRAGLPPPSMTAATQIACGPSSSGYEYMAGVVRALLPLMERHGIASAAEVDIETLAARMREDSVAHERVTFLPRVVGAWTRIAQN